jgi:hypothetical protein
MPRENGKEKEKDDTEVYAQGDSRRRHRGVRRVRPFRCFHFKTLQNFSTSQLLKKIVVIAASGETGSSDKMSLQQESRARGRHQRVGGGKTTWSGLRAPASRCHVWISRDERRHSCQTVAPAQAQATWANNEDMTIHFMKH